MAGRRLNIAVLAGYWSTNIGNAFFQLGAEWLLRRARPDANVFLVGDQPGYWNVRRGNPPGALDYAAHVEVDAIAVLGPFCRPEMRSIVGNMLRAQHARGAKIIVLAAGMMSYDDATVALAREMLRETPPWLLTTRDTETYERLGDLAEHAHDGIDVATFVSDLFAPVPSDLPPYVVLNFDQIPEPEFLRAPAGPPRRGDRAFEWEGASWVARPQRLRTALSYRFRAFPFVEPFLPGRRRQERFGDLAVVRTDHRFNPFLPRKTYAGAATYAGDVPHTYLNLYANAACTISNRVHACVATVSFGRPAMLFTRSPRAQLLERLGLDTIQEKPTCIDPELLRREKDALIEFVAGPLRGLEPRGPG